MSTKGPHLVLSTSFIDPKRWVVESYETPFEHTKGRSKTKQDIRIFVMDFYSWQPDLWPSL